MVKSKTFRGAWEQTLSRIVFELRRRNGIETLPINEIRNLHY